MSKRVPFGAAFQALRVVLVKPVYGATAVLVSGLALAVMLWLQNVRGIVRVAISPLFSWPDVAVFLFRLLGGIVTSVSPLAAVLIVIISVLFGVNATLLIYSLTHRSALPLTGARGSTVMAAIGAVLGAGCASCGTYLLGSVLASLGASGLLALLPLGGQELLLVSIVLLLLSIGWVGRAMYSAGVCPVPGGLADS